MSLVGKIVLVTGGTRGIGKAISKLFAKKEAIIISNYRADQKSAIALQASLPGNNHELIKADIGDPDQAQSLINQIISKFKRIDILINNAGIGADHAITKVNYQEWQEHWKSIVNINLIAVSNLCYLTAHEMMKQNSGKIINISSRGAFRGEPDQPAYGASKAALNSLTQSLAYSLSPYDIFVGAIAPGFVETDMAKDRLEGASGQMIRNQSPMKRVATPEEVAEATYLMACSPIWMTGGIFDVNGASYFRT